MLLQVEDKAYLRVCPPDILRKCTKANKNPNANRGARQASVPLPGGMPMNLTIVTGGEGSARVSNNAMAGGTAEDNCDKDPSPNLRTSRQTQIPSHSTRPYKSFPKVKDFLRELDENFDRNFQRFTRILTDEDYLGYSRIYDIVTAYGAVQNSSLTGGEWLKDRIERTAASASEEGVHGARISDGSSTIIFQQMLATFKEIDSA